MSHWYDFSGASKHEIMGTSSGRLRPTTIKDARANGWFPSVTTVLDILSKPQLDSWKQDQVALAARRVLKSAPASFQVADDKTFCSILKKEAFQQVEDAADLGTRIHAALEPFLAGQKIDAELEPYLRNVPGVLKREGIEVTGHELRLVNAKHGYAGTTDCPIKSGRGLGIMDAKTRKTKPEYREIAAYDGQATQIAAYHAAHYATEPTADQPIAGCNLFISSTEIGRVELVWHDASTLADEWEFFKHLLRCWQIRNGYVPPRNPR